MISILSAILFRCGGWGKEDVFCPMFPIKYPKNKVADFIIINGRELIGILLGLLYWNIWLALSLMLAVQIPYGDNNKNWIRKLVGKNANWLLYGFCFGVSSCFVISWWGILQGAITAMMFWILMDLSNTGRIFYRHKLEPVIWKLNHAYVELGIGFIGTLYTWMLLAK